MHMQDTDEVPMYQMATWVMHGKWPSLWQPLAVQAPHQLPGAVQTLLYFNSQRQLHIALYSIADHAFCGADSRALPIWRGPLLEVHRIKAVNLSDSFVSLQPLVEYRRAVMSVAQSHELCAEGADVPRHEKSHSCECSTGSMQLGAVANSSSALQWSVGVDKSRLMSKNASVQAKEGECWMLALQVHCMAHHSCSLTCPAHPSYAADAIWSDQTTHLPCSHAMINVL
jgi:hypothetical protein